MKVIDILWAPPQPSNKWRACNGMIARVVEWWGFLLIYIFTFYERYLGMSRIHKTINAKCPKCNKEVGFEIVMRYVDYNGILPCLRCPSCNVEVPHYSFNSFLQNGIIIIGV